MRRRSRGIKRKSSRTFRRRLLLVRLLLRGPKTRDDLITMVNEKLGEEGYPRAAEKAFRNDITALRKQYECYITNQRRKYYIEDLGNLEIFDLPDDCLEALMVLKTGFPKDFSLFAHANVPGLVRHLEMLLPEDRWRKYKKDRASIYVEPLGRSPGKIDPSLLAKIDLAIERGKCLIFNYQGLPDTQPRRHQVQPRQLLLSPESHSYLVATVLETTPPGPEQVPSVIKYRLDRIEVDSIEFPTSIKPAPPFQPPTYRIRYHLAPSIARRRDVASYFEETEFCYYDDGSATATAVTSDLWNAQRILLRYGAGCRVEEPPELVSAMREAARGLYEMYCQEQPTEEERAFDL